MGGTTELVDTNGDGVGDRIQFTEGSYPNLIIDSVGNISSGPLDDGKYNLTISSSGYITI
jgi:hypothetical protein